MTDLSFSNGIDGLCEIIYNSMIMNKLFGLRTRSAKINLALKSTHFTYRIYLLIQEILNSITVLKVSTHMLISLNDEAVFEVFFHF